MKKNLKKVALVLALIVGVFGSAKLMSCYKIDPVPGGIVIPTTMMK